MAAVCFFGVLLPRVHSALVICFVMCETVEYAHIVNVFFFLTLQS